MTTTLDRSAAPTFDQERYDTGKFDGVLEVLNSSGDMKIMWDRNNPGEVTAAKAAFDQAIKAKSAVFAVKTKGGQGDKVKEFDPNLERLMVVPQLVGG
jgi:hypothetical protein